MQCSRAEAVASCSVFRNAGLPASSPGTRIAARAVVNFAAKEGREYLARFNHWAMGRKIFN